MAPLSPARGLRLVHLRRDLRGGGRDGQTPAHGFRIAQAKGLTTSCTFDAGVWTLHVASKSGKPLRMLLGDKLFVGVARSKNDPPGGALTFNYHQG